MGNRIKSTLAALCFGLNGTALADPLDDFLPPPSQNECNRILHNGKRMIGLHRMAPEAVINLLELFGCPKQAEEIRKLQQNLQKNDTPGYMMKSEAVMPELR